MKILSTILDRRINSWNLYAEMTYEEYLSFAEDLLKNNDLQRRRVKSSKTVYSLLKKDLITGCIMPSLTLAIQDAELDPHGVTGEQLEKYINENKSKVLILDGLQRTYTLLDAEREIQAEPELHQEFQKNSLRVEIYLGINKFGVLYRMLTLNTGQTPMSIRHQIEMLYNDLLGNDIEGIKIVRDNEGTANAQAIEFIFSNVVEGFNAYTSRNEMPITRQDLLENIKMMEHMATEDVKQDLFATFIKTYAIVFKAIIKASEGHSITDEETEMYEITGKPFGANASKIFSTSQAFTGFGSALGKMRDKRIISGFGEIEAIVSELRNDGYDWMLQLLKNLDTIRNTSKKIGNSQRLYFHFFFRELFNKEGDSYLDLDAAVDRGYEMYFSQEY